MKIRCNVRVIDLNESDANVRHVLKDGHHWADDMRWIREESEYAQVAKGKHMVN